MEGHPFTRPTQLMHACKPQIKNNGTGEPLKGRNIMNCTMYSLVVTIAIVEDSQKVTTEASCFQQKRDSARSLLIIHDQVLISSENLKA